MIEQHLKRVYPRTLPDKIKILWFSNTPTLPTGYGLVSREVLSRLAKDPLFEVYAIGSQHNGAPFDFMGFKVLGVEAQDKSGDSLQKHIDNIKPDVVIFLEDSFTLAGWGMHQLNYGKAKVLGYLASDGDPVPDVGIPMFRRCDHIVAMTKFNKTQFAKEMFLNCDIIYHGVDLNLFCKASDEQVKGIRKKLGWEDKDFILFNFSRNSHRKQNQRMIEGIYPFLQKHRDAKAFFHIIKYNEVGLNLVSFIERNMTLKFGENLLNKQIFFNWEAVNWEKGVTDKDVAEMIQASNLVVSSSSGEGYGLIMPEANACHKPVVTHEYSTPIELIGEEVNGIGQRGILVPSIDFVTSTFNVEHGSVDMIKFGEAIEYYYNNRDKIKEHGDNGRLFVERYNDWNSLVWGKNGWVDIIKKVL